MEVTISPATIDALFWMQIKVACIGWGVMMFNMMFQFISAIAGLAKK